MKVQSSVSFPVSVFMAGDIPEAEAICREFCDEVGLCVTVSPATYVYTGGAEPGFVVGLINYPRFPAEPEKIEEKAVLLGMKLREALGQESFSVQTPIVTRWFSWRPADTGETP